MTICASYAYSTRVARTAFEPRRNAILLIGGDKTGDKRWYEQYVPIADRLHEAHLETLEKEGQGNE